MQFVSLVWGILAILGLGVAFIPCLGALNWLNIPFAIVGLIISILAAAKSTRGQNGMAIAAVVLNTIAILFGMIRLMAGGGIL